MCTASRKPSAAESRISLPLMLKCTPVSTGRESSVAAAKTTWISARRRRFASTSMRADSSTGGIGGKSSGSIPPIDASLRAQESETWRDRSASVMTICSCGSVAMKSESSREGIVIAPGSSTSAVIV